MNHGTGCHQSHQTLGFMFVFAFVYPICVVESRSDWIKKHWQRILGCHEQEKGLLLVARPEKSKMCICNVHCHVCKSRKLKISLNSLSWCYSDRTNTLNGRFWYYFHFVLLLRRVSTVLIFLSVCFHSVPTLVLNKSGFTREDVCQSDILKGNVTTQP